ncbi:hypothetical protein RFI_30706 [Reticulomyxa filosa]|uniref:Uncharacterized protein n=1 Tax=Reticulomyxa filosa TaxID=46433 RepID=X6LZ93_RETFI|nr:hypothetical protein RFI_30706 [Reticulomyxa filosa]|eukprot:ETO06686.1 hypothetical protein RFI_30706 [Reticulomyxa filosa]
MIEQSRFILKKRKLLKDCTASTKPFEQEQMCCIYFLREVYKQNLVFNKFPKKLNTSKKIIIKQKTTLVEMEKLKKDRESKDNEIQKIKQEMQVNLNLSMKVESNLSLKEEIQIIIHYWIRTSNIKLGWIKDFDKFVVNYVSLFILSFLNTN